MTPETHVPATQPAASAVEQASKLSVAYLERSCEADGRFRYWVDPRTDKEPDSYNIVAHAGAIYSLAMYNRLHPDPDALAAMLRAGDFLRKNYLVVDRDGHMRIVWPVPFRTKLTGHTPLGGFS